VTWQSVLFVSTQQSQGFFLPSGCSPCLRRFISLRSDVSRHWEVPKDCQGSRLRPINLRCGHSHSNSFFWGGGVYPPRKPKFWRRAFRASMSAAQGCAAVWRAAVVASSVTCFVCWRPPAATAAPSPGFSLKMCVHLSVCLSAARMPSENTPSNRKMKENSGKCRKTGGFVPSLHKQLFDLEQETRTLCGHLRTLVC
jgi:hypothetical protein